jgi:hypothetical protein
MEFTDSKSQPGDAALGQATPNEARGRRIRPGDAALGLAMPH